MNSWKLSGYLSIKNNLFLRYVCIRGDYKKKKKKSNGVKKFFVSILIRKLTRPFLIFIFLHYLSSERKKEMCNWKEKVQLDA